MTCVSRAEGFRSTGFIAASGSTLAAAAWAAWARPISAPSRVTKELSAMFCALKGATLTPSRASQRQMPATTTLFPASEWVPATSREPLTAVSPGSLPALRISKWLFSAIRPLAQKTEDHSKARPEDELGAQGREPEAPEQTGGEPSRIRSGGKPDEQHRQGEHESKPYGEVPHRRGHLSLAEYLGDLPGRQDGEKGEQDHREVRSRSFPDRRGISHGRRVGRVLDEGDQERTREDRRRQGQAPHPICLGGQARSEVRVGQPEDPPYGHPEEARGEEEPDLLGRSAEDLSPVATGRGLLESYGLVHERFPDEESEETREESGQQPGRHPAAQVRR